jgi:hypothetical protein
VPAREQMGASDGMVIASEGDEAIAAKANAMPRP